jgi:hypothetical protein
MRKADVVLWWSKRIRGQASLLQVGCISLQERGLPAKTVDRLDSIPALYVRQILRRQPIKEPLKICQETVGNFVSTVAGNR